MGGGQDFFFVHLRIVKCDLPSGRPERCFFCSGRATASFLRFLRISFLMLAAISGEKAIFRCRAVRCFFELFFCDVTVSWMLPPVHPPILLSTSGHPLEKEIDILFFYCSLQVKNLVELKYGFFQYCLLCDYERKEDRDSEITVSCGRINKINE